MAFRDVCRFSFLEQCYTVLYSCQCADELVTISHFTYHRTTYLLYLNRKKAIEVYLLPLVEISSRQPKLRVPVIILKVCLLKSYIV